VGCSWVRIQHNVARAEAYLPTKWHLDPSSHLATTDMSRKLGGLCPFGGGGAGSHCVARAEAYLHAKFHLDPSNRLATVHQRHRQDMDRQRSDSIGRTVLQQRSNRRICCLRDVICNEAVPFCPYCGGVGSVQCVFVPGDLDL